MRKMIAVVGTLWLLPCMGISTGCLWDDGDLCQGTEGPDCPPIEPQCEAPDCPPAETHCDGRCVAYMDSAWDMALVGAAPENGAPLHCPASAPNEGFSGKQTDSGSAPPLRVIACSANPAPTCDSPTAVCMPFEPNFLPCIVRDGTHTCKGAYPNLTMVEDETGAPITICCEKETELT